jgi:xylulokinase
VAGVDCSTQATKVVVVEAGRGTVVATGRADHVVHGTDGARETDPEQWWSALGRALANTGRAGDIGALAVAGQQHGLVALDVDGRPVRPALLWNDTRSAPDAARLIEALGAAAWAESVGSLPPASFTVTKWAWLRRTEPDKAAATAAVRLPHDFVTERLTGRAVTDRGDASGTGWWSSVADDYTDLVLDLDEVGLDRALLPEVLDPFALAGAVQPMAAGVLGLSDNTVVAAGTGDNMAAALGLGLAPGQPAVSLGTSGTVFMVSEKRPADPSGVVAGFADATGRFLPLACTLNCTLAVDQVAVFLGLRRDAVEPSDGVVVLPYFEGERTPNLPGASGTVLGLRSTTTPGQILMAAYEGAAASLIEAIDALAAQSGGIDDDAPLVMVGGGSAGPAWREVIRRLSGRALLVPDASELTALGAAVQATAASLGESPGDVATRWGTAGGTVLDPHERDDECLDRIRSVRAALVDAGALGSSAGTSGGGGPGPSAGAPRAGAPG